VENRTFDAESEGIEEEGVVVREWGGGLCAEFWECAEGGGGVAWGGVGEV